jgi:hypothetical protein
VLPVILLAAVVAKPAVAAASSGPAWSTIILTVAGIITALSVVVTGFVKFVWPAVSFLGRFKDDWDGEDPRPGVPGRPGVMKRLETVEFDIAAVKAEVNPDHGNSIKDVVNQTSQSVNALHDRVDAIDIQREGERVDRG